MLIKPIGTRHNSHKAPLSPAENPEWNSFVSMVWLELYPHLQRIHREPEIVPVGRNKSLAG